MPTHSFHQVGGARQSNLPTTRTLASCLRSVQAPSTQTPSGGWCAPDCVPSSCLTPSRPHQLLSTNQHLHHHSRVVPTAETSIVVIGDNYPFLRSSFETRGVRHLNRIVRYTHA